MTIFGIGTVVVDDVVELPRFPEADTKVELTRHWQQVGGPVPVALSTAAFYGSKTSFMGRWGNDETGRLIQKTLQQRSIDLSCSRSADAWTSGRAQVWVDSSTGSRTIAFSRGDLIMPDECDIDEPTLKQCQILHLDGWAFAAAIKAASIVNSNGGTVVLDAGSVKPGMHELLPLVNILIASALFRKSLFGHKDVGSKELLTLGPENIITTDGENGAAWHCHHDDTTETAVRVNPVDTNGAGDIFSGAILHAITNKWSRSDSLKFANRVAGFSCAQHGNYSLPTIN